MLEEARTYELLHGHHIMDGPDGKETKYLRGSFITTKTDLERLNVPGYDPKFRRVHEDKRPVDSAAQQPGETAKAYAERLRALAVAAEAAADREGDTLDAMTVEELRAFAESEEIPLGEDVVVDKAKLTAAIRSATLTAV